MHCGTPIRVTLLLLSAWGAAAARVAIVGGGVAAASTAHHLRQLVPGDLDIDVFEQGDRVGGRALSVTIDDHVVELGASIIHQENVLVTQMARAAKLTLVAPPGADGLLALFNGAELVFKESSWRIITFIKLLWRYGFDPWFYRRTAGQFLERFEGLYAAADAGTAFVRPHDALRAVSCFSLTQQSFVQYIHDTYHRYSPFAAEMVAAASLANYGQPNIDLNAMAGLVSLLPATDPRVYSIAEGNERLVGDTLAGSGAAVRLRARVTAIAAAGDGTYQLSVETDEGTDGTGGGHVIQPEGPYDAVIIAAPLDLSSLTVTGVDLPVIPRRSYHTTVTTIVRGVLRPTFFGLPPGTLPFSAVLATEAAAAAGTPFASLSRVAPLAGFKALWKVHSPAPVPPTWLGMLFEGGYEIAANRSWAAYPAFDPPENFPPFQLAPGLFYPGAWESAASAMEMAAVGGRNVALLAAQHLAAQGRGADVPEDVLVRGGGGGRREGPAAAAA